jgi:hypothetical protein
MALAIIIIPKFYVTGDGPSHTYNAKVLIDYLLGNQRQFYKPFYEINRHLDPNWTSQIVLGVFTKIFPYWLADKAFQVLYVCVFAFGFRYLLRTIAKSATNLSLLFYPFCFTIPFQMGFYNYSLALGILFVAFAYFLNNHSNWSGIKQCMFMLISLVLALTHGMVATHFIVLVFIYVLMKALLQHQQKKSIQQIFNDALSSLQCLVPAALIVLSFVMRQGLSTTPHPLTMMQKLYNFMRMYCNISTTHFEVFPAVFLGICIVLLSVFIFVQCKCNHVLLRNTFLLFALYTFATYINAPNTLAYAGGTDIRTAFLPWLFIVFSSATYSFGTIINKIILVPAFGVQLCFVAMRILPVMSASNETKQAMQLANKIETNKTVLTIQYNTHGSKNQIDADNSFLHIFDYVGAMQNKHLIILNNFEADLNYFSLHWRPGMNPKSYMPNIIQGDAPTIAQMQQYEVATKNKIDYIIWQADTRNANGVMVKKGIDTNQNILLNSIGLQYDSIDGNAALGLILWKRKN